MHIAFYSHDVGPCNNNKLVAKEVALRGHTIKIVDPLGNANLFDPHPDFLVTGLSSFMNAEEIALGVRAKEMGIPWVILADTHRAWARPPAKGKVSSAYLLIATPEEIHDAVSFGYDIAKVRYIGGPPKWQEFRHIKPVEIPGHQSNYKLILVGGIKDALLTDRMLELAVNAANSLYPDQWQLIFKPHPAEEDSFQDTARRNSILQRANAISTPEGSTSLLASVSLSIFTGGATDTIAAAHLRRPTIFYEDKYVRARNEKQLGEPIWYPAESGACAKATPDNIINVMHRLLTPEGAAELRKHQEKIYPLKPQAERIETQIVKFFESPGDSA